MPPAPDKRRVKVKDSLVSNPDQDVAVLMRIHKFPRRDYENNFLVNKIKHEAQAERRERSRTTTNQSSMVANVSTSPPKRSQNDVSFDLNSSQEMQRGKQRVRLNGTTPVKDKPELRHRVVLQAKKLFTPFKKTSSQLHETNKVYAASKDRELEGRKKAAEMYLEAQIAFGEGREGAQKLSMLGVVKKLKTTYKTLTVKHVQRAVQSAKRDKELTDNRASRAVPNSIDELVVSHTRLSAYSVEAAPFTQKTLGQAISAAVPGIGNGRNIARAVEARIAPSVDKGKKERIDLVRLVWGTDYNVNEGYNGARDALLKLGFATPDPHYNEQGEKIGEITILHPDRILNIDETPITLEGGYQDGSSSSYSCCDSPPPLHLQHIKDHL